MYNNRITELETRNLGLREEIDQLMKLLEEVLLHQSSPRIARERFEELRRAHYEREVFSVFPFFEKTESTFRNTKPDMSDILDIQETNDSLFKRLIPHYSIDENGHNRSDDKLSRTLPVAVETAQDLYDRYKPSVHERSESINLSKDIEVCVPASLEPFSILPEESRPPETIHKEITDFSAELYQAKQKAQQLMKKPEHRIKTPYINRSKPRSTAFAIRPFLPENARSYSTAAQRPQTKPSWSILPRKIQISAANERRAPARKPVSRLKENRRKLCPQCIKFLSRGLSTANCPCHLTKN